MRKKPIVSFLGIMILIIVTNLSTVGLGNQLSACLPDCKGVVDKAPNNSFIAEIAFKNTGTSEGTWIVNVAFEGESWTWAGTVQILTLKPSKGNMLKWNGTVPETAPVDSVARLIVYYNDSFIHLDWWIHVVPGAELTVTYSHVK